MRCLNYLAFSPYPSNSNLSNLRFESLNHPFNWQTWQTSLRATNAQGTRKRIRMVAGVRNLPIASTIRFEIPIVEIAV